MHRSLLIAAGSVCLLVVTGVALTQQAIGVPVEIRLENLPNTIAFDQHGSLYVGELAFANGKRIIRVYDPPNWNIRDEFESECVPCGGSSFALSADGKFVASSFYTASGETGVQLVNTQTHEVTRINGYTGGSRIAFSHDNGFLVVASIGRYSLWDLNAKTFTLVRLKDPSEDIWTLVFHPRNPSILMMVGRYGGPFLRNAYTGEIFRKLRGDVIDISAFASFSPDGRYVIASGQIHPRAYIWETDSGKIVTTMLIPSRKGSIQWPVFSPDGRRIAALEPDGVWLRDARTGLRQKRVEGLDVGLYGLTFSPDGRLLAAKYPAPNGRGTVKIVAVPK